MKFRLAHKLTSYLLAATGLLTLWSAQIVSPWIMLAVLLVGALSWFVEVDTSLGLLIVRAALFFNVLTVALFTLSVLQVARSFPEVDLSPFLNFVLDLKIGFADFIRLFSYLFPNMFLYSIPMAAMIFLVCSPLRDPRATFTVTTTSGRSVSIQSLA